MSFSKTYTAQVHGLTASVIEVEVDISKNTLHAFSVVGLPDKAVEESRDRISAAIKNSGYKSPKQINQKIVVSLAPAHIKKSGSAYDTAIALAYLQASGDITCDTRNSIFLGELSLDGVVRSVPGILALTQAAKQSGFTAVFVPKENAKEAGLVSGIDIFPVETLSEIIGHLTEEGKRIEKQARTNIKNASMISSSSFDDIRGQLTAKRALVIAAAGKHNVALYGPPGTGKTMPAKALKDILPPLSAEEIIETTTIHSIAGSLHEPYIATPPFESPHHGASHVAIIGGGAVPKPGAVTLAHNGVLFLDEFPEFERRVIDGLRTPLEDRVVHISRAQGSATYPAHFIFIAALNPCPCGNYGSDKECVCMPHIREKYQKRISGPIVDRIDMWIEVPRIPLEELGKKTQGTIQTDRARDAVARARMLQTTRFGTQKTNGSLSVKELGVFVPLAPGVRTTFHSIAERLQLSPRSYHRIIKLARTIADLEENEFVEEKHILEALQYRPKLT